MRKKNYWKKYIKNEKIKQDCAWGVKDQRITINKDFNCIEIKSKLFISLGFLKKIFVHLEKTKQVNKETHTYILHKYQCVGLIKKTYKKNILLINPLQLSRFTVAVSSRQF